ncbi:hypothetical protein [Plantactinospora endophytica]|uniref:Uncharacterized protein n=1 Tax=Plantactinospora endophytica TaxID=673535 RepID=A0ABQ4DUL8_9ACTN|nr:hypothetical protein [Plantactinospora endophytica]GIG86104.1 hypothetical protein Pen02_10400 [Plantactinospora endophytica]
MKSLVRLPHLAPAVRCAHAIVAVVLLLGGTYGLALTMLMLGIAPEMCVLTTAAITGVAVQATRCVLPLGTGPGASGPAARPPRR